MPELAVAVHDVDAEAAQADRIRRRDDRGRPDRIGRRIAVRVARWRRRGRKSSTMTRIGSSARSRTGRRQDVPVDAPSAPAAAAGGGVSERSSSPSVLYTPKARPTAMRWRRRSPPTSSPSADVAGRSPGSSDRWLRFCRSVVHDAAPWFASARCRCRGSSVERRRENSVKRGQESTRPQPARSVSGPRFGGHLDADDLVVVGGERRLDVQRDGGNALPATARRSPRTRSARARRVADGGGLREEIVDRGIRERPDVDAVRGAGAAGHGRWAPVRCRRRVRSPAGRC